MNINTIISDNVVELLNEVTDNTLREKIIQLAANNKASSSNVVERSKNEFEYCTSYYISKIICDHRLTQIESTNIKSKNIVEENTLAKSINIDPKENMFLGIMQIVTTHKWYIKCTILIDNTFSITDIAMIDSGVDVSCIQEGLVPTKYFEKTTHMLYLPIILGTPFINVLYPFTSINAKAKRLITILKVLHLNRDMKVLICWKIIDGMVMDLLQAIEESNAYWE
ncbi:hypothetical protein H5410_037290 [Solanum commersonii]|uniref:Uncharacterized protein n=1 Tax=Solanum commersonii TaxID=4109 RepID=A0A9J5Y7L3_SOLCO|nr:hypothetical protein H5410_037290 [Solanum commersonii]